MNGKTSRTQVRRLAAAVFTVCALVAAVPASGALANGLDAARASDLSEGIDARALMGIKDPFAVLAGIEELAGDEAVLPEYFEREIGMPAGARAARASEDELVVGYLLDGDAGSALETVKDHMGRRGWSEVPLGDVSGATFVKQGGACSWTLATCTQSGDETCVVFRSVVE